MNTLNSLIIEGKIKDFLDNKEVGIRVVGRLKLTRWNDVSKVVIIAEHIEFKKIN